MNVKELMVVTHGYEGGLDSIDFLELVNVKLNKNRVWWYGKHEETDPGEDFDCTVVKLS